jgi:hypothetical protein
VSFEYQNVNIYFSGSGRGNINRLTARSCTLTGGKERGTEEEIKELEKSEAGDEFKEYGSRAMETTGKEKRQRPDEQRRTETITKDQIT